MPRPTTKTTLLEAANQTFERLWQCVDALGNLAPEGEFPFVDDTSLKEPHWRRDRNVRDVLVHLHEWHNLWLEWVAANQSGVRRKFLPEPHTFKTTPALNHEFWLKHQTTSYAEAVLLLKNSHHEVVHRIELFSDDELFTKQYFDWTGSTSLGSYCVSATSSHYEWAIKKLKKYQRLASS